MENLIVNIPSAKETLENTPLDGFNYAVESVVKAIERASKAGKRNTCFNPSSYKGDYYESVKREFSKRGYTFSPTGYSGGVWQLSEEICW